MLYIPVKYLKPGMILARDLPSDVFYLSLLTVGHELTASIIEKLKNHKIQGAYVESTFCNDIESEDFIDPVFKCECLSSIKKQFDEYMSRSVSSATNLYRTMSKLATDIVSTVLSKDEFLLNMIDIRDYDTYTYSHSMFVGLISVLIGLKLGLSRTSLNELAMGGLLHDIGKLDISTDIINKPTKLTPEEFSIIQEHPSNAVARLRQNHLFSSNVLLGIESHHERYDGSGYPRHLEGKNVPLYGRIMALADVYDALISERSYRAGWPPSQAIEYMMSCSSTHFDHDLLQVFLNVVAAYPTGSMVKLSNGYLAVVIHNTSSQTLRPTIRILQPVDHRNEEIDLATDTKYLNVVVEGTFNGTDDLPKEIFA